MYKVVKYGYITENEDRHHLPTICVYGGIDDEIGISAFAYLKEKFEKDGRHFDFIYSRYEGHVLFFPSTEDGKQAASNGANIAHVVLNSWNHFVLTFFKILDKNAYSFYMTFKNQQYERQDSSYQQICPRRKDRRVCKGLA